MFDFLVGFGEVLSDDAEGEELDAAEEEDNADHGGVSGDGVAVEEGAGGDKGGVEEGGEADGESEGGDVAEGFGGEGEYPFGGVADEFFHGPFGMAAGAFVVFEREPAGFEADPAEDPFGEAAGFGEVEDSLNHGSAHQAEIAGPGGDFDGGEEIDDVVEESGAEGAEESLAGAADASGGDMFDPFAAGDAEHLGQE